MGAGVGMCDGVGKYDAFLETDTKALEEGIQGSRWVSIGFQGRETSCGTLGEASQTTKAPRCLSPDSLRSQWHSDPALTCGISSLHAPPGPALI